MTPAMFLAGMVAMGAALCVGAVRAWRVLEARPLRPLEAWVGRLAVAAVMALPLLADAGALPGPRAPSVGLPLIGGTMTGQVVFSGVSTDITTGTNQDLTLAPNGTGDVVISNETKITTTGDAELTLRDNSATGYTNIIGLNSAGSNAFHIGFGNASTASPYTNNLFVFATLATGKVAIGSSQDHAAGADSVTFYDNSTVVIGGVDGNGAYRFPDRTSAHGATCNAANEGLIYYRSISASNKSGFCVCAETSSGAYGWKMGMTFGSSALTDGDC